MIAGAAVTSAEPVVERIRPSPLLLRADILLPDLGYAADTPAFSRGRENPVVSGPQQRPWIAQHQCCGLNAGHTSAKYAETQQLGKTRTHG